MKANSIGELFGTLQQSVVDEWRKHLKTSKYSKHMALDEFYKEMPELVDQLIEDYQAINGIVDDYKNVFDASTMNALEYLEELRTFVKESRPEFIEGESELESDLDNILSMIDSTIYKVRELKENKIMSLKNYLLESLNTNEAMVDDEFDVNEVYKGFKKVQQAIRGKRLPKILDKLVGKYFTITTRNNQWDVTVVEQIITHFVDWSVLAYDEFAGGYDRKEKFLAAYDWYENIVTNEEQIRDGGVDDFIETYDYEDKDHDEMENLYMDTLSKYFSDVYEAINHKEVDLKW